MRKLVLLCVLVCSMVAFAAEPTTSSYADLHEGRAHGAYLVAGSSIARAASAVRADDDLLRLAAMTPDVLATVVALVLVGVSLTAVSTRQARDGSVLRWATIARRGPPARV